jgi:hypothetical protein
MSCGAETEANALLATLLAAEDVTLPEINFDADAFKIPDETTSAIKELIVHLKPEEISTGSIEGSGVFDIIMRGMKAHLTEEYNRNRITGAEYTKAYVALVDGAMQQSIQFLINKDQVFWQAQSAQLAAYTARVQLEAAKMQLATAKFQALTAKSEYGLTKMKISSESMAYCTAKFQLDFILPLNKGQLEKQLVLIDKQTAGAELQNLTAQFQLDTLLPAQKLQLDEQTNAQRAQTSNTRLDGTPVVGILGKQKDLYQQQIVSYQRDAEVKAAKLFTDAWITMKTIDEGLLPPTNFQNTSLDAILADLKTNNAIG